MIKKTHAFIVVAVGFALLVNPSQAIFSLSESPAQKNLARAKALLKGEFVANEILVQFKDDTKPFQKITVDSIKIAEKLAEYMSLDNVVYAEPNYKVEAFMVPDDSYYSYQWNFDNDEFGGINMEKAWDISQGQGVTVAVVDTGIAYEDFCDGSDWWTTCYKKAPDLADTCFVEGYDFVNNDTHPNDDSSPGHGTHIAGTIAQSTNNSYGVAGVAHKACLMPIKILNSRGGGTYADMAEGIYFAADHGAQVINISSGGSSDSSTLKNAVSYAYNHGVTIVAGAGNSSSATKAYPAGYDDYVIAVGATQYDQELAYYSNYGSHIDLVAPGGNSRLDQNSDGYGDTILQQSQTISYSGSVSFKYYFMQGTSMAAPHVSGVAALVLSNGNASTPDQVKNVLQTTAEDLGAAGKDNTYGWGLIDAFAALGGSPQPTIKCNSDAECSDQNECTADTCLNPGSSQASCQNTQKPDNTACSQGICCNGSCAAPNCSSDSQCNSSDPCRSGTCQNAGTCSAYCSYTNQPENTSCPGGICCAGSCQTPLCSQDTDCDDSNACTIDTCLSGNTCQANCQYQTQTSCISNDGCCPSGCSFLNDSDCQPPPVQDLMHISNISFDYDIWNFGRLGYYCRVTAEVEVKSNTGQPVPSARIYGHWSDAYSRSVSASTNSQGIASFSTGFDRGCGNYTFSVDNIVKSGWTYDFSSNTETSDSINLP